MQIPAHLAATHGTLQILLQTAGQRHPGTSQANHGVFALCIDVQEQEHNRLEVTHVCKNTTAVTSPIICTARDPIQGLKHSRKCEVHC
jgi:hypothetical protein